MSSGWTWQQTGEAAELEKLNTSLRELEAGDAPPGASHLVIYPLNPNGKRGGAVCFVKPEILDSGHLGLFALLGPGAWHIQAVSGRKSGAVVRVTFEGQARRLQWESPFILAGEPANVPAPWGDKGQPTTPAPAAARPDFEPVIPPGAAGALQLLQIAKMLAPQPAPPPPPPPPAPDPLAQLAGIAQLLKAVTPPPRKSFIEEHGAELLTVGAGLLTAGIGAAGTAAAAFAPHLMEAVGLKAKAGGWEKALDVVERIAGKFLGGDDGEGEGDADADPPEQLEGPPGA